MVDRKRIMGAPRTFGKTYFKNARLPRSRQLGREKDATGLPRRPTEGKEATMSDGISAVGSSRHSTGGDDGSTNAILERDTGITVDIHGADATQRELALRQKGHVGVSGAVDVAATTTEGVHIAEAMHFGALFDTALTIGLPIVGLGVGTYELGEAHRNADEQADAIVRDQAHVAVIASLDLPEAYAAKRLNVDYQCVDKGWHSRVQEMT
jgi:hypothetical protein